MACYHPIKGFYSRELTKNNKRVIVFNNQKGYDDMPISVPCGNCIGCRLDRAKNWAVRCVHEASLYENNCFITLTFNEDNIEKNKSLDKIDFQKFMKRLRKEIYPQKVRYFHCGEYGSQLQRPHHHACLFGYDFADKILWSVRDGIKLYRSPTLEKLWTYGYSTIGEVTYESACYVARYVLKKITGKKSDEHYQGRVKEYVTMSRRPGIGHEWLMKFKDDIYNNAGRLVLKTGSQVNPPRYYDEKYMLTSEDNNVKMLKLKKIRADKAKESQDNTWRRLRVREVVQEKLLGELKRGVEDGTQSL